MRGEGNHPRARWREPLTAYFTARQRESDGRWDYTCQNSAGTFPIGYCSGHVLESDKNDARYHDDGHATSEEAIACYRRYELDQATRFVEDPEAQKKCQVCGSWTTKRALVGNELMRDYVLCEEHANHAELEKLHT